MNCPYLRPIACPQIATGLAESNPRRSILKFVRFQPYFVKSNRPSQCLNVSESAEVHYITTWALFLALDLCQLCYSTIANLRVV